MLARVFLSSRRKRCLDHVHEIPTTAKVEKDGAQPRDSLTHLLSAAVLLAE